MVTYVVFTFMAGALIFAAIMTSFYVDHKIRRHGNLLLGVGAACQSVAAMVIHSSLSATVNAGVAAWALYIWWNGSGGDGLKRRLKAWTSSLRRPVPQSA